MPQEFNFFLTFRINGFVLIDIFYHAILILMAPIILTKTFKGSQKKFSERKLMGLQHFLLALFYRIFCFLSEIVFFFIVIRLIVMSHQLPMHEKQAYSHIEE